MSARSFDGESISLIQLSLDFDSVPVEIVMQSILIKCVFYMRWSDLIISRHVRLYEYYSELFKKSTLICCSFLYNSNYYKEKIQ